MEIEYHPIAAVKPYPDYPDIDDATISVVIWSIREIDFCNPILVNERDEVISGHVRLAAAQRLGMTEVPVIVCDNMPPDQVHALRLIDYQDQIFSVLRVKQHATA